MPRIRTVKPEFFLHEDLFDAERETGLPLRLAFIGLWTACDREGRFKWRPRTLKSQVMPHDDIDFSRVLDALGTRGFVVKYASEGVEVGWIPSFTRHQVINNRESASSLPPPPLTVGTQQVARVDDASITREARVQESTVHAQGERKGKERKGEGKEVDLSLHPTLEEVTQTCQAKGYRSINPTEWWAYWDSIGWCDRNGRPIKWQSRLMADAVAPKPTWKLEAEQAAKKRKGDSIHDIPTLQPPKRRSDGA